MSPREAASRMLRSQSEFSQLEAAAIAKALGLKLSERRDTWTRIALNIGLRLAADKSLSFRLPAAMIAPVDDVTLR